MDAGGEIVDETNPLVKNTADNSFEEHASRKDASVEDVRSPKRTVKEAAVSDRDAGQSRTADRPKEKKKRYGRTVKSTRRDSYHYK